MKPPYEITNKILVLIVSISEKIGEVNAAHLNKPPTELRIRNRIKTIQSSLEIEGNTLTVEQLFATDQPALLNFIVSVLQESEKQKLI
jgi:Fic family protein